MEFKPGRWGCVSAMLFQVAKGKTAVFSSETAGCPGGSMGLGFSSRYPQEMEFILSTGKEGQFEGKSLKKTPELVKDSLEPHTKLATITEEFVILKPINEVDLNKENPSVIVFFANADQLTALCTLVNYGIAGNENVIVPFAAGCQSFCSLPLAESKKSQPRAIIGMLDISARPFLDADLLSFSLPVEMFNNMEANIPGSFLDKKEWLNLSKRI
jgi:uncharacterized protein (DUF169 family)